MTTETMERERLIPLIGKQFVPAQELRHVLDCLEVLG